MFDLSLKGEVIDEEKEYRPLLQRIPIDPPRNRQTVEDFKMTPTFFSVGFWKLFWRVFSKIVMELGKMNKF
jgi:hypothetical protein